MGERHACLLFVVRSTTKIRPASIVGRDVRATFCCSVTVCISTSIKINNINQNEFDLIFSFGNFHNVNNIKKIKNEIIAQEVDAKKFVRHRNSHTMWPLTWGYME
jgi:hypothetical protein